MSVGEFSPPTLSTHARSLDLVTLLTYARSLDLITVRAKSWIAAAVFFAQNAPQNRDFLLFARLLRATKLDTATCDHCCVCVNGCSDLLLCADKRFLACWLDIAKQKDGIVTLSTGEKTVCFLRRSSLLVVDECYLRARCHQGVERPRHCGLNLDSPEQMDLLDLRAWCKTRGLYSKQQDCMSAKKELRRQQSLLSVLVHPVAICSAASNMILETLRVHVEVSCDSNMVPCIQMASMLAASSMFTPWSIFEFFKMDGEPVVCGK